MKKTKRIWGIILALALAVTATACQNEEDNRSNSDTSSLENSTASSSENENGAYMPPPDENYVQPDNDTPAANLAPPYAGSKTDDLLMGGRQNACCPYLFGRQRLF